MFGWQHLSADYLFSLPIASGRNRDLCPVVDLGAIVRAQLTLRCQHFSWGIQTLRFQLVYIFQDARLVAFLTPFDC